MVMTSRFATRAPALLPAAPADVAFATPYFLLRVGGLPIDAADQLRFTQTEAWIAEMFAAEQVLDTLAAPLSDALQAVFVRYRDDQSRRRMIIDAKRSVAQRQIDGKAQPLRAAAVLLDPPAHALVERWFAALESYRTVRAQGEAQFAEEVCRKRHELKQHLASADLRAGIVLSSPDLDQALDKYLVADERTPNKQARRAERSLMEYVLRTTTKTSPFSTLTAVCAGSFCDQPADGPMVAALNPLAKRSHVRLHIGVLSHIGALIMADAQARRALPVTLTPGWQIEGRQLRYVRRRRSAGGADAETAGAILAVHEEIFYLPLTNLLQAIIEQIGSGRVVTLDELAVTLDRAQLGRKTVIENYLNHLMRLDLLITPQLQIDMHSPDPLAGYRAQLQQLPLESAARAAAHLGDIGRMLARYDTATPAERRELLVALRRQVETCYADLGRPDMRAPRTLVYEDTILQPERLAINLRHWNNIMDDLHALQTVLPLFDANLPRRLVMRGFFQARYGAGSRYDDVAAFAHRFQSEFLSTYNERWAFHSFFDRAGTFRPRANDLQLPELDRLNAGMQELAGLMQEALSDLPPDTGEVILDRDWLARLQAYVPASGTNISSDAFFAQLAADNGKPLLVVNQIHAGLGSKYSRFAHFLDHDQPLIDALRASLHALLPPDAVFAEIKGGYDTTNLNLHPQVTPYEIVCPGDSTLRPTEEQIPLDDLYIVDDRRSGRLQLRSRRLDREVIPLYLGFLVPMMLPKLQQVLLQFGPEHMCRIDLWAGAPKPPARDGVAFHPRLRYRDIVLHRAMWHLAREAFPARESGESDPGYLLRLARWRRTHNIPERVFVTVEHDAEGYAPIKPFYVDFTNYFSVIGLEAVLRSAPAALVLSEMLPGRDHLWLRHAGQAYVSEFVIEVHQTKRGE